MGYILYTKPTEVDFFVPVVRSSVLANRHHLFKAKCSRQTRKTTMKQFLRILIIAALPSFGFAAPETDVAEPDIVIRQMDDKIIHEYRINGFLYAIKVIPKKGKPYFLVAEDGSDNFARADQPHFLIPKWEIFTW